LLNDERTFLRGAVEFFDDEEGAAPANPDAQRRAIDGYNELQSLSSSAPLDMIVGEPQLSFRLAQAVPDLTFRQALLAMRSEADRIRQIAEYLPAYLVRHRRVQRLKDMAPRNGHGQRSKEDG
jgi:hypothetical protein